MQDRAGGAAVARRAADLLGVRVQRLRHVGVHDQAHVGLVDAHAEGGGGHDDVEVARAPRGVHLVASLLRHGPVIRRRAQPEVGELVGVGVGLLARRHVHERRTVGILYIRDHGTTLVVVVLVSADGHVDLGAVHPAHLEVRVAHAEARDDVVSDGGGCRGGERQHRGMAQRFDGIADARVVGPEIVGPRPRRSAPRRSPRAARRRARDGRTPRCWPAARGRGRRTPHRRPRWRPTRRASRSRSCGSSARRRRGRRRARSIESIWSRCRARRGEMTTVTPPSSHPAIWYTADLPAPVGKTTRVSRPLTTASIASACPGSRSSHPKTSRAVRADCSRVAGAFTKASFLGGGPPAHLRRSATARGLRAGPTCGARRARRTVRRGGTRRAPTQARAAMSEGDARMPTCSSATSRRRSRR